MLLVTTSTHLQPLWASNKYIGGKVDWNGNGLIEGVEVVLSDIIIIAAVLAAIIAIFKAFRSLNTLMNKFNHFFDDWYGEDARQGFEARPGVLTRLADLETNRLVSEVTLNDIQETVNKIQTQVEHELNHNGGGSTKDAAHEALKVARAIQQHQEADAIDQAKFRAQYLKDMDVTRKEWETVFSSVQSMIGKETEEQMAIWTSIATAYANKNLLGENDA